MYLAGAMGEYGDAARTFGQVLRDADITPEQLAKRTGIDAHRLAKIRAGSIRPNAGERLALEKLLGDLPRDLWLSAPERSIFRAMVDRMKRRRA